MASSSVVAAYTPSGEAAPSMAAVPSVGVVAQAEEAPSAAASPPAAAQQAVAQHGGELLQRRPRVLLGVSGSVATIKLSLVAEGLLRFADVKIVATKSACHFFDAAQLPPACLPVLTDDDEWTQWQRIGDPVVHIELRRWADAFLVAPLSANTLAKLANGLCDNLLTCVVRAWDFQKPLLVAPAMNTFMWQSPFTEVHLEGCRRLGVHIVPPVSKRLACGDVGEGGMAGPDEVVQACRQALEEAGH